MKVKKLLEMQFYHVPTGSNTQTKTLSKCLEVGAGDKWKDSYNYETFVS